jgi:hypothetical protein
MICERCKSLVPEGYLACPGCVIDKGREAMRELQHHPLRELEAGRGRFQTRQFNGAVHLKMFHCALTFCDISIEAGKKGEVAISKMGPGICQKCREALEEIMRQMQRRAPQVAHPVSQ